MFKVGDWVVIENLHDSKNWHEGKVIKLYNRSDLVDIWMSHGTKWTINKKYLRKIRKEITKEEYINASLDLGIKEWFMSLTGGQND